MHTPDPSALRAAANLVAAQAPISTNSVTSATDLVSMATQAADGFRGALLGVVTDKIENLERNEQSFAKSAKLHDARRRIHPRMTFYSTPVAVTLTARGLVAPFAEEFRATSRRMAGFLLAHGPAQDRSPLFAQVVDEVSGIVWASLLDALVASGQPSRQVPSPIDACRSEPSF